MTVPRAPGIVLLGLLLVLAAIGSASAQAEAAQLGDLSGYGALGAVTAWLLWRDWRRDQEHRAERGAAWSGVAALGTKLDTLNENVVRLVTLHKERR